MPINSFKIGFILNFQLHIIEKTDPFLIRNVTEKSANHYHEEDANQHQKGEKQEYHEEDANQYQKREKQENHLKSNVKSNNMNIKRVTKLHQKKSEKNHWTRKAVSI